MFPPKSGAPAGQPRGLKDIRRDVGVTQPDPALEAPREDRAEVALTCPDCGASITKSLVAQPEEVAAEPVAAAAAPAPPFAGGR